MLHQSLRFIPKRFVIRSKVSGGCSMFVNQTHVKMSKQAFFCTETVKNASDVVEPPFVSSIMEEQKEKQYASNSTKNRHVSEAFERINLLSDQDTFTPQTLPKSDNDEDFGITGQTLIRGRAIQIVYLSVSGTRVSEEHVRQLKDAFQDAGAIRTPVVCLYDFRCTSIQEGKSSLSGLPFFFGRNMSVSGEVPLISLTFGPSLGAVRSLHPSSSFIFRVKNGYDMAASSKPEMPYFSFEQDIDLKSAREFIHFLTSLREETENFDPTTRRDDTLNSIISPDPNTTYNMKNIIRSIVDDRNFCELMLDPARNIHTGFARMNGQVVAIVANQTCETAGVLNYDSSAMTARFVRFANAYNVPILTFVDVPGLLSEGDVLRKGRELLFVYKDATVPRISIVTRKAHNDAYDVISSDYLRGKFNYSWATTPQILSKNMAQAKKSLYHSIEPSTTRERICKDLESLKSRKSDPLEHLSWKEVTSVVRNWLLILFSLFVLIRYVC